MSDEINTKIQDFNDFNIYFILTKYLIQYIIKYRFTTQTSFFYFHLYFIFIFQYVEPKRI